MTLSSNKMPNKWDHLPNAKLIDWVIADVKDNPGAWEEAWSAVWNVSGGAAWRAAMYAAMSAVLDSGRGSTWNADRASVAWGTIAALIAYDDCSKYLDMTPDELHVWTELSNDPSCILLLPMVIRKNI